MKKNWALTQASFDKLLDWLDADREEAGRKYEAIRVRLIKIFTCRGCSCPEELTDELINRVAAKVSDPSFEYEGEPALYFYAFVPNMQHEYVRRTRLISADLPNGNGSGSLAPPMPPVDDEPEFACLDRCLERLPDNTRRLVLGYYQDERQAKIDHRRQLAIELGIALNALRIRAHRIRRGLEKCVRNCVEQQPAH